MRCSSCEPLLDRYLEGTLMPRQMRAIAQHVATCDSCAPLLTELRVVDGLLATTAAAELPPNFTFALMAEARSMPAPRRRVSSSWRILGTYLAAAWIALSIAALGFGVRIGAIQGITGNAVSSISVIARTMTGAFQAVAPFAPAVVVFVVGILFVDLILVATILLFYRTIRPRLAAHLATSEAS